MPQLNRRGPEGTGPMTGRGMGRCNPENKGKLDEEILQSRMELKPEQENRSESARGTGSGLRCGLGHGWGRRSGGKSKQR